MFSKRRIKEVQRLSRGVNEMLYQNDSDYIFDSSKIEKASGIIPTPYEEGVKTTVESYR
jgi:hypothetical protein